MEEERSRRTSSRATSSEKRATKRVICRTKLIRRLIPAYMANAWTAGISERAPAKQHGKSLVAFALASVPRHTIAK